MKSWLKGHSLNPRTSQRTEALCPSSYRNHDDDEIPGKWISAEEDEVGLKLTGQFNLNTAEGKRRYEELKHGDLNDSVLVTGSV